MRPPVAFTNDLAPDVVHVDLSCCQVKKEVHFQYSKWGVNYSSLQGIWKLVLSAITLMICHNLEKFIQIVSVMVT